MNDQTQLHWLVRPKTIKLLWRLGFAVLAVLVLADLVIHQHASFGIDGSFGFYSWYGLLTCFWLRANNPPAKAMMAKTVAKSRLKVSPWTTAN